MAKKTQLSPMAQTIAVNLEQTMPKDGESIAISIAKQTKRCSISIREEVGRALEELTECGYAEARAPGFKAAASAIFYHRLLREYRLTARGHDWRCEYWEKFGVRAPHH
jgi:hypothetical protein